MTFLDFNTCRTSSGLLEKKSWDTSKIRLLFLFVVLSSSVISQNEKAGIAHMQKAEEFRRNLKPDSALLYYKKAVSEFRDPEKIVNAYNQIATVLTRQDKYDEARIYLEKSLKSGLDTNGLLIATTYITYGVIYSAEENYTLSLFYHNKALNARLAKLGENNAEVATSYGNIGNVKLYAKDIEGAIDAHKKAMLIREKVFGKESVEITESFKGLGNAYKEKKDYKTALEYHEKALKNKILQRGEKHKDLTKFYKTVSDIHYLMENKEQGEIYKAKADECSKI